MDIFSQNKILFRITIMLAILNIVSLGFFIWKESSHRPPPPPGVPHGFRDVSQVLKKELDLTNEQAEQINKLRAVYFEKEKIILNTLHSERDSMNAALFNKDFNLSLLKSLARNVSDNEYKMEILRIEQAQELKNICSPSQLEKFESLVIEIRDYFRPNNQPPSK